MDNDSFVVRSLPGAGLDGAFRVHLAPDSLERLGLRIGEVCVVKGEQGTVGHGIAWRATDRMGNAPKLKPAKMSDTMRSAFGFKEGSHVTISKSNVPIAPATKVLVSDVTPSDYPDDSLEGDNRWIKRADNVLLDCEAITAGMTFDVNAKKARRKRFFIDHIESAASVEGALYFCDGTTNVSISGAPAPSAALSTSVSDDHPRSVLDLSRIGGLVEQAKELNKRLDRLLDKSVASKQLHVVLHGFQGTGKTLLLRQIEAARRCKVLRVITEANTSKTLSALHSVFERAKAEQPAVVLLDKAEKLLSKDNEAFVTALITEMDELTNTERILVIAAVRSINDMHGDLRMANRFQLAIELPIPDLAARRSILTILTGCSDSRLPNAIAAKTHGFTGDDLTQLVDIARDAAIDRLKAEAEHGWVDVNSHTSPQNGTLASDQTEVSELREATTKVEAATTDDKRQTEFALAMGDFQFALQSIRPSALRELFFETPEIRWSDIGGSDGIREQLDDAIGLPLRKPDLLFARRIRPAKGILLYGPPGCSKTMTAQAVAAMYDLNFIAIKGAELISMYVGESERSVREIFHKARQAAPCIIFFDEIDAIGSTRDGGGHKGLNVVTTLLTEMDGFEALRGVTVLAATNKPQVLDPALLRPGRFDTHIYVGPPNAAARQQIIEMSLRGSTGETLVASPVAVEHLTTATEGYSGAEIVQICKVANLQAAKAMDAGTSDGKITQEHLNAVLAEVPRGITGDMLLQYHEFAGR